MRCLHQDLFHIFPAPDNSAWRENTCQPGQPQGTEQALILLLHRCAAGKASSTPGTLRQSHKSTPANTKIFRSNGKSALPHPDSISS